MTHDSETNDYTQPFQHLLILLRDAVDEISTVLAPGQALRCWQHAEGYAGDAIWRWADSVGQESRRLGGSESTWILGWMAVNCWSSKARIKIPLLCHCGDEEIPRLLSIHGQTVLVWLQKYLDYAPCSSPLIMSHSLFAHFAVRNVRKPEFVSFHEVRRACVHDRGQGPTFSQCGWRLWPQSWLPALLWGQPQT